MLPCIITIISLCLGITSILYSIDGKFNIAVALIIIAGFLDGIDGRIARMLKSTSEFGAQLDSFADLCSFGIAPGISIYLWSLQRMPYNSIGWSIVLIHTTCSALRLARFHIQLANNKSQKKIENRFFTGIPMPVAAGLLLIPMMLSFELTRDSLIIFSYWFIGFYMIVISLLMVSKIPIYSAKDINISKKKSIVLILLLCLVFIGVIFEPWFLLPIIGILYILCLIPLGSCYYYREIKK